MLQSTAHRMRDRSGHERGQTLPLVVCFLLVLLLMCGCVVDFGNAYRVRAQLQASTDAAATAAADQLPVVDPQRDVIDNRKRSKSLGQAAQINGRQSNSSR